MFVSQACRLTIRDFTILEAMVQRSYSGDELIRSILREKLSDAVIMFREDIPSTVVTIGSRVTYRMDMGLAETGVIQDGGVPAPVGTRAISIDQPLGLALLGMSEGERVILRRPDGEARELTVVRVDYQPEAASFGTLPADTIQPKMPRRLIDRKPAGTVASKVGEKA